MKSWLIGKDPDAVKDWRQEEKEKTEDDMVGWHHRLNGHEFEQALGGNGEQRSLPCHSPCGHKQSDMTWRLNNNTATTVLMWLLKSKDSRYNRLCWSGKGKLKQSQGYLCGKHMLRHPGFFINTPSSKRKQYWGSDPLRHTTAVPLCKVQVPSAHVC